MSFILSDRVKEYSLSIGSGSVVLNGPLSGFQSFSSGIGDGNTTYYAIENESRWEVGVGTYTYASNSLSRDTVLASSNNGNKIALNGVSVVFCTYPASKAVVYNPSGNVGINTNNPQYQFHVEGSGKFTKIFFPDGTFIDSFSSTSVLPDQVGNSGKFLSTNGINPLWTNVDLSSVSGNLTSYIGLVSGNLHQEIAVVSGYFENKVILPIWGNISGILSNQTDLYNELTTISGSLHNEIVTTSGWSKLYTDTTSGNLKTQIDSISGWNKQYTDLQIISVSGWSTWYTDTTSGNLKTQIDNVSGWSKHYTDLQITSVSGSSKSYIDAVSGWADGKFVPKSRSLSMNGTSYDLSADRSWTVGDVRTDGSYSNPSWITSLAVSKLTGIIDSSNLPSYVDDVLEYANSGVLPALGETGKIYVTTNDNRSYRWSGSTYIQITDTTALWGEITGNINNQTDLQNALSAVSGWNKQYTDSQIVSVSGWSKSYVDTTSGNLNNQIINVSGWNKQYTDSQIIDVSGWSKSYIDITSGNLNTQINNVSGWNKQYTDLQIISVSGWSKTYTDTTSGNLNARINSVSGYFENKSPVVSGVASGIVYVNDNLIVTSTPNIKFSNTNPTAPRLVFQPSGTITSPISLSVLTNAMPPTSGVATLSFDGTAGQLFSITDQLSTGTIFNVGNITGLPLFRIDASGNIYMVEYGRSVKNYRSFELMPSGTTTGTTSPLRFYELTANGSNFVGFKAPDSIYADTIWTLPSGAGASGFFLATDSFGQLSWNSGITYQAGSGLILYGTTFHASGLAFISYVDQTSGNLNNQIVNVSGWNKQYTDAQIVNVSGWAKSYVDTTSGNLSNQIINVSGWNKQYTDIQISSLSGIDTAIYKVPYTGASGNVNLGNYSITANKIGFNLAPSGTHTVGEFIWDAGHGAPSVLLSGGNVAVPMGQKSVSYCYNGTASTLTKGQVVYISGAQGQEPMVALASATRESTSSSTFGLVGETITSANRGYIITLGELSNVNTSMFTEGAALWLSPSGYGNITETKPQAPDHIVLLGYCIKSNASSGRIFVKIQNGYELDEIHNVKISGVQHEQIIAYNSGIRVWENVNADYIVRATSGNLYNQLVNVSGYFQNKPSWTISDRVNSEALINDTVYFSGISGISTTYDINTNTLLIVGGGPGGSTYSAGSGLMLVGTTFHTSGVAYFNRVGINTQTPTSTLMVISSGSAETGIVVRGATGQTGNLQEWQDVNSNRVAIITAAGSGYFGDNVTVSGQLTAKTKSFLIDHPTKPGMKLQYACLEGPENGVYIRGFTNSSIISLPDYWSGLVDENSITVNVTAINWSQPNLYVKSYNNQVVELHSDVDISANYVVYGTRKDIKPLEVEYGS